MLTPQPPVDMLIDKSAEAIITGSLAVITACALLFAIFHWAKSKRPLVLMLMLAGGAMMVMEPMVDTVGACWFPSNSWTAFNAWGRPIPVWLCIAYFFYFGIGSALVWMGLRKGMTYRQMLFAYCAAMVGDLIFETVLLSVDPYTYYGHQPLMVGKFPMWWAATNGLVPFALGTLIFKLDGVFRGWRYLYIVPMGLMVTAATNAAVGWPSWFVINSDLGPVLTQAGGLTTFALAFWVLYGLSVVAAVKPSSSLSSVGLQPSAA